MWKIRARHAWINGYYGCGGIVNGTFEEPIRFNTEEADKAQEGNPLASYDAALSKAITEIDKIPVGTYPLEIIVHGEEVWAEILQNATKQIQASAHGVDGDDIRNLLQRHDHPRGVLEDARKIAAQVREASESGSPRHYAGGTGPHLLRDRKGNTAFAAVPGNVSSARKVSRQVVIVKLSMSSRSGWNSSTKEFRYSRSGQPSIFLSIPTTAPTAVPRCATHTRTPQPRGSSTTGAKNTGGTMQRGHGYTLPKKARRLRIDLAEKKQMKADLKRATKKRGQVAKKIRKLRNKAERLLRESERDPHAAGEPGLNETPAIPEEAFRFLDSLRMSEQALLGGADPALFTKKEESHGDGSQDRSQDNAGRDSVRPAGQGDPESHGERSEHDPHDDDHGRQGNEDATLIGHHHQRIRRSCRQRRNSRSLENPANLPLQKQNEAQVRQPPYRCGVCGREERV